MTVDETLELARSYGVEVRLNAAGDGLDLEVEADPPQALLNALTYAKWNIVAALRQRDLLERHRSLLGAMEDACPPDVTDPQWQTALRGLKAFIANGHGDEALRLDWSRDELFRVPERWSQIHLCGVGLLVNDSTVIEVTATRIGIRIVNGSPQGFYRRAAPDYGLAYRERLRLAGEDGGKEEVRLRALEAVVNLYRSHHPSVDFETAKATVLSAIQQSSRKEIAQP
jgi:hypothetical protein